MSKHLNNIIKSILILVLLIFAYQTSIVIAIDLQKRANKSPSIETFSIPEMPARVDAAEIVEGGVTGTEIKYTITNLTKEKVQRIDLVAMVFDKDNELIRSAGLTYDEDLSAFASNESLSNYLENEVKPNERIIIAIHAIVGETGTWEVDSNKLKTAVKSYVSGQYYEMIHVRHDKNFILSDADKTELYRMTLESLLKSDEAIKHLSIEDAKNIILSTEEIDPKLVPKIEGVNIHVMTPEEIQKKRWREGLFGFFYFYPITIEGNHVQIAIMYRKDKQVGQNAYTPCCGTLDAVFHKENGKWIEEYSQVSNI